jgi:hypothetical protein
MTYITRYRCTTHCTEEETRDDIPPPKVLFYVATRSSSAPTPCRYNYTTSIIYVHKHESAKKMGQPDERTQWEKAYSLKMARRKQKPSVPLPLLKMPSRDDDVAAHAAGRGSRA